MELYRFTVILLSVFVLASCDSDSRTSDDTFNLKVSAADEEGKPQAMNGLYWGYVNERGQLSNTTEILCNAEDWAESCPELEIGMEAHGAIRITAIQDTDDAGTSCDLDVSGYIDIEADPSVGQYVVVVLDQHGGTCP